MRDDGGPTIDVCYIVSHGFASRMLVQTDLLGRLSDAGKRVALIAPELVRAGMGLQWQKPRSKPGSVTVMM